MLNRYSSRRGFLLIMALWVLGFLTILAVTIGMGTRQKIVLLSRLEDRSQARLAAEAGVKKAVSVLVDDLENNQFVYSSAAKVRRHNNPGELAHIEVGKDTVDVLQVFCGEPLSSGADRYGVCDEQGKVNLNVVDEGILRNLIADVLSMTADDARKLSDAVVDWRDYGRHEMEGFFSEEYYANLEYPYAMKEDPFERIDELLLVKGFDKGIYEKLRPYITVYGDGRININTVSAPVLKALGLDPVVVDKIVEARRGGDGREMTEDDHVFFRTFDVPADVDALVGLEDKERRSIDDLNRRNLLTVNSTVYSLTSRVRAPSGGAKRTVDAVYNALTNKFEYWHEK